MKESARYERILELIGYGRFNVLYNIFFPFLACMVTTSTYYGLYWVLVISDHWCKVPMPMNSNYTIEEWRNITIPRSNQSILQEFEPCKMYDYDLENIILYKNTSEDMMRVRGNIEKLELMMPRYAIRGGDVELRCDHSVSPDQLYKVEWRKSGNKIFEYIKGRRPPFKYYPILGAELNKVRSNQNQVTLSKLDFGASGTYTCIVSMETPIFSKDSDEKELTIIEPQEEDPVITFNKATYELGDILEANCTTSPSRPPPHITWLINGEKVLDSMTKAFSVMAGLMITRRHGHSAGYFEQRLPAVKQLMVEVSELHVGDDGELRLTCMSTIPGYLLPGQQEEDYADIRQRSVTIDIELTEGPVEAISNTNNPASSSSATSAATCILFNSWRHLRYLYRENVLPLGSLALLLRSMTSV